MRALRFAAPLLVAAIVALAPVLLLAWMAKPPADASQVGSSERLAYAMAALAFVGQLALAGGVHANTGAAPRVGATRRAIAGVGRAAVPALLVVAAVVIGSLALVVPGLLLLALLALVGPAAQGDGPVTAVLARATEATRRQLPIVAAVVAALVVADVGLAVGLRVALVSMPAKPSVHDLATTVRYLHALALALLVISPALAAALAARYPIRQ
jgi:hypothetical protein|nr:hypothetical protein [Kofleriaceae bacterium]